MHESCEFEKPYYVICVTKYRPFSRKIIYQTNITGTSMKLGKCYAKIGCIDGRLCSEQNNCDYADFIM